VLDVVRNMSSTNEDKGAVQRYPLCGVPTPLKDADIANKAYVDAAVLNLGMGDLEFLRDKELAGDIVTATGLNNAVAPVTVTSITPAAGKTFFLVKATGYIGTNAAVLSAVQVDIENDGTAKESFDSIIPPLAVNIPSQIDFGLVADSLVGDGAKIYRIQKVQGIVLVYVSGMIEGWIQDT